MLTENDWRDVEVMENGVNQAHLFCFWPNDIALMTICKERVYWFLSRLPDILGRGLCAAMSIDLEKKLR